MKKILLDTHILIRRESNRTIDKRLQEVMCNAAELGYQPVVHRSSVDEIKNDKNIPDSKRSVLLSKVETYPRIDPQPSFYDDKDFLEQVHGPEVQREAEDLHLLYCLYKEEVDLFLTEDSDIVEKAVLLGISGKVKNLRQAAGSFRKALSETKSGLGDVPVFCFYKEGEIWYIGETGKKISSFKHMKGFEQIHLLLQHPDEWLASSVVHSGGKMAGDQDYLEQEASEYRDDVSAHSRISYNEGVPQTEKAISENMEQLRHEIETSRRPDEVLEKKMEYEKLERYLEERKREDSNPAEKEAARSPVYKTIQRALAKIHDDKALSSVSRYLNNQTIITGGKCVYRPLANDRPIWKLSPDFE